MTTFNFNGIDFSDYLTVNDGIQGRGLATSAVTSINIRRRTGTVFGGKEYEERVIDVPFTIKATSPEDLRDKVEVIAGLLHTDSPAPLIFSDEDDRTYYAVSLGSDDLVDVTYRYGQGVLSFLCNDPIKYGVEKTTDFVDGAAVIQNRGTLPAKPLFRAEVLSDITYMDVFTDTAYMRIGQPQTDETPVIIPNETVLHNDMGNGTGTTVLGTEVDGGVVDGSYAYANSKASAADFGTGSAWHGPAAKQAVPESPLTDFSVQMHFIFPTTLGIAGRMETYLLDDLGNHIGKIAIVDTQYQRGSRIEVRIGGGSNYEFIMLVGGGTDRRWDNMDGVIRITRKGNVWEAYAARVEPGTNIHSSAVSTRYVDEDLRFTSNLSQVQTHIGKFGNINTTNMRITDLKVIKHNLVPSGASKIIAQAGDTIEINHKESAIYINGESRKDLKDFGGTFFSIERGDQAVLIEPREALNGEAIIKEEYL